MIQFVSGIAVGALLGVVGAILVVFVLLPTPALPINKYGRFVGELSPKWLNDGRRMKLNSDFLYVDPFDKAWIAPKDSVIDGASIPQVFWSLTGGPFEGQYRNASVVHDVACVEMKEPSEAVHQMFYFACRCGGVSEARAKALYFAVLRFGPRWKIVHEVKTLDGVPITVSKGVDVVPARPLSEPDAKSILDYFEKNNPGVDQIPSVEVPLPGPLNNN
jgi:Protein of unknown function (DUF1353)